MKKHILAVLVVSAILGSCSRFLRVQKSDNIDLKYKAALDYYAKKDYYHAGTLFEEMIPILKGQAEAEKAQFYYAYCQYFQGQLVLSAYYFKKFYETFQRSELAEEAYYMHCVSLYEDSPEYELDQTNTIQAIESIQQFLERYPKTKYMGECNIIIDKLTLKLEDKAYYQAKQYYKMMEYRSSAVAFDNLIKDFPSSKYVEEAGFLKLESQYYYATISIEEKRFERYQLALEYYLTFLDKYPESKYLKESERIYDNIQLKLSVEYSAKKAF